MKMDRTRNATRNITTGIALKIYQLITPFIIRTIMIYLLGMEYVGLNSLFTSILSVLNLTELGVGSAMVYSMYKPIAEDDKTTICSLMKLYRTYYRIIGFVVLVAGLIILPFIPKLIAGDVPEDINIYVLYLLNLAATVVSYWLFAYKNSLLTAYQRTDIINNITIRINTLQYILQATVLLVMRNYYAYLVVALLSQIALNIVTAYFASKMYPGYEANGELAKEQVKEINQRIKDLFTSKMGGIIVNSADTIVISAFLGLTILGIYNNYFYIMNSVFGFITIIFTACTAGIGNSLIVDTKEKNLNDLSKLTFLIAWIGSFCSCCFLCLYQPFMLMWAGETNLLSFGCVICFVVYFYIRIINQVLVVYKDAAGMWHEDRFRPLVTALANLILNIIMVQVIGIYGILLSTVLSTLLIGMPWIIHNMFRIVFKSGMRNYVRLILKMTILTAFVSLISCFLCSLIKLDSNVMLIAFRLAICCIIPNAIFYVAFRRTVIFKDSIRLIDNMVGKRINVLHKVCLWLTR